MPLESEKRIANLLIDARVSALASLFPAPEQLWIVGGTIRDALLDVQPKDIDFSSPLTPEKVIELCEARNVSAYPTGARHLTVTVIPAEGLEPVEISTFRGAGMRPNDGKHFGSTIEEDLSFRDFTINSLALNCQTGALVDPFNGKSDLEKKLLKATGDARERFLEDPLRILRLVRFVGVLGFQIEEKTFASGKPLSKQLEQVSPERVRDELSKLLVSKHPQRALLEMERIGALAFILPEVQDFVGFEQNRFHYADLWSHTLEVVEKSPAELRLRIAALLHDVGKPLTVDFHPETNDRTFYRHEHVGAEITKTILTRLRFSHRLIGEVCELVRMHMRPLTAGKSGIRRLIRDIGPLLDDWQTLKFIDSTSCNIDPAQLTKDFDYFKEMLVEVQSEPDVSPLANLAIDGHDLIEFGLQEGRRIGEILRELHEKVLDDPSLNQKSILLGMVEELI